MSDKKILIEAYIEEKQFVNPQGEVIDYLALTIPVTDKTSKNIKADKLVLELARERALKNLDSVNHKETEIFKK